MLYLIVSAVLISAAIFYLYRNKLDRIKNMDNSTDTDEGVKLLVDRLHKL